MTLPAQQSQRTATIPDNHDAGGTVGKAMHVLDVVAASQRPVRFHELIDKCGYPKPTLYRLLQTLVGQRMLDFTAETQTYSLGARLLRLAHYAWNQSSLAQVSRPHIQKLSDAVHETVHLAQLEHGQVLYLDKCESYIPVHMYSQTGKVGPGYCTGIGKVMMAFLPSEQLGQVIAQQSFHKYTATTITSANKLLRELGTIRDQQVAYDNEEHEQGIICIAAPILAHGTTPIGGVSITSTTNKMSLDSLAQFKPQLLHTAKSIADEATLWQFPN